MNTEQLISLADVLRAHALQTSNDLNASNLFVHRMLMHALNGDGVNDNVDFDLEEFEN